MSRPVALVLFLLLAGVVPSTRAEDYYLCFPEAYAPATPHVLVVADSAAAGSVEMAGIGYSQPFSLAAGGAWQFDFPESAMVSGSDVIVDRMVRVTSDVPIHVSAYVVNIFSLDACAVREAAELGTDHVVASYPALSGYASEFAIVAPGNGTIVSITPLSINDSGRTPGVAYQVSLDAGEVYQLQASSPGADLTGSIISANQDVAVFSGNELANVPTSTSTADFIMTQLAPTAAWGTEIVVPKSDLHALDIVRIMPLGDGTLVTSTDGLSITLNSSEVLDWTFSSSIGISASGPVQVVHYFQGANADAVSDADPSMAAVPPRSDWRSLHRVEVFDPTTAGTGTLAIVAPCSAAGFITVDDVAVPPGNFTPLPDNSACIALEPVAAGPHVVAGPDSCAVLVYWYDSAVSYAYYDPGLIAPTGPPPALTPVITAVEDVPNDQGRQVRLEWNRSPQDGAGSLTPITSYAIFRRHDPALAVSRPFVAAGEATSDWDYLLSVPAFGEPSYATIVPTLADSTLTGGLYESVFFVRAATASPYEYFDSPPDTGYSVDNLEPSAPLNLMATRGTGSGNRLSWDPATETDFMQHRVYRGASQDFVPGPGDLVAVVTANQWTDPDHDGWDVFYKVTTVDFSGNESDPAREAVVVGVGPGDPVRITRLLGSHPNPFRPSTAIRFELEREGPVRIRIHDVHGRLVRDLLGETLPPGRHLARWDGRDDSGREAHAGVYFVRLEANGVSRTGRVVRLE